MEKKREISEREMYFFLTHISFLGPVSIERIRERVSPLSDLFRIKKECLAEYCGISARRASALAQALSSFEDIVGRLPLLGTTGTRFISPEEEAFPEGLREIHAPPSGIFCRGHLPGEGIHGNGPAVAVVGSRSCTSYGREAARYIVRELTRYGISIISGMAEGIDAFAHRAALEAGGETYGVLGCGVDICYPRENFSIYEELRRGKQGGLLSELPMGTRPLKGFFPMRNRLIAGLSNLVVVIEARERSGSLITADHALDQGKDIYVLPGRINDPLSRGCNRLIASGAGIINSVEDILNALQIEPGKPKAVLVKNLKALANPEKTVYSCLDLRPKYLEDILEETGLTGSEAMHALLNLEMSGLIRQISGQYYELTDGLSDGD